MISHATKLEIVKRSLVLVCAVFLACMFGASAGAQDTGFILGTITDKSGAVIVGAHVTAQSATGLTRTVTSNSSGSYILSQLPIGNYTVMVEAQGFEKFTNTAVQLSADQNVTMNAQLRIGGGQQEITVTSAPPQIDTHSDTISQIIPQELVSDIPSSTGQPFDFIGILPGVSDVSTSAAFTGDRNGPRFNVSGSRSSDNLLLLDGLMHLNFFRNTGQNYPPPDFLDQIELLIGNYGAQYGHNTGGIMNVVTKSGGNQIHGSLWEYDQNTDFDAKNYYTGALNTRHFNRFGVAAGGPIKHNRLFYFVGYEAIRQYLTGYVASALPPTQAERGLNGLPGDFSADAGTAGKSASSYLNNPNYAKGKYYSTLSTLLSASCASALGTGQYIATAQIPNVCLNSVIQNLNAKYLPTANLPNNLLGQYYPQPLQNDVGEGRADWNFGKHMIDGRYIVINSIQNSYTTSTNAVPLYEGLNQPARTQTVSFNDTWTLSPTLLNVIRLGYNRFYGTSIPTDTTSLNALGSAFPILGKPVLPAVTVNSRMVLSSNSTDEQKNVDADIDLVDNVNLVRGNHVIQTGAEYLRLQYMNRSYFYTMGQFTFTGTYTGDSMADYMLGFANSATAESPQIEQTGIQNNMFLWFQDDWKVNQRLTLNLGLRYELPLPWYQPQNWWATFRPGQQSTKIPSAPAGLVFPGDSGVPRGEVPTRFSDFAPRFGFAFDVFGNGRTALRGGFGIFYDEVESNIVQNNTQPYVYQFSPNVTPASISNPYASGPTFPTTVNLNNPTFITPFTLTYPDRNLSTPYVEAANLNIQQQITNNLAVQAMYVGKFGHKQFLDFNSNPALYAAGASTSTASYQARRTYGTFGNNADMATVGNSNYNSLQILVTKRMSGWLSAMGSYAWSRSLDEFSSYTTDTATIPNVFGTATVPAVGSPLNFNFSSEYGPSDFNAAQIGGIGYTVYAPKLANHNRLMRELAGGWNFSGRYTIRTGEPVQVYSGTDWAQTNSPHQRPEVWHDWVLSSTRPRSQKIARTKNAAGYANTWFDTTAFCGNDNPACSSASSFSADFPSAGTFGNLSRNAVTGPATISNNMSMAKSFRLPWPEDATFGFRCDAFGVFNTPNLGTPSGSVGSSLGQITSTSGERYLQLSGKIQF